MYIEVLRFRTCMYRDSNYLTYNDCAFHRKDIINGVPNWLPVFLGPERSKSYKNVKLVAEWDELDYVIRIEQREDLVQNIESKNTSASIGYRMHDKEFGFRPYTFCNGFNMSAIIIL